MKRIFLAINIIPQNSFIRHIRSLQNYTTKDKIKWVDTDNVHLTLRFFGATAESDIPRIIDAVHAATQNINSFSLQLKNTGLFGSRYNPRVIWMGTEPCDKLMQLHTQLVYELTKAGFPSDQQNFVPHITLGRINRLSHKPTFQQIIANHALCDIQVQKVQSIYLYESILLRNGPQYNIEHIFNL